MKEPFLYIKNLDYKSLEEYLRVEDINVCNENGQNLLILSIINEFDNAFDLLIKNSININALDNLGNTALNYAIIYNKLGYFKRLVREGANLNITNKSGESAIMLALNLKREEMAKILLDYNVCLDFVNKNNENICFSIIKSHNKKFLIDVLSKNPKLLYSINFSKKTLLHEACTVGDVEIAKFLLTKGILSNCADNFGETPLFIAVREKNYDLIDLLLSFGALMDKKNDFFETIFDIAKPEIKEYLLYYYNSAKYIRYTKKYPLHSAVIYNDFIKVKQLTSYYNFIKKDDFNNRPIDIAHKLNYVDIYNFLKRFESTKVSK